MESVSFNSCLNKKLSIDKNGFVKNCPSMVTHFGRADEVSLLDVACDNEFKRI